MQGLGLRRSRIKRGLGYRGKGSSGSKFGVSGISISGFLMIRSCSMPGSFLIAELTWHPRNSPG